MSEKLKKGMTYRIQKGQKATLAMFQGKTKDGKLIFISLATGKKIKAKEEEIVELKEAPVPPVTGRL